MPKTERDRVLTYLLEHGWDYEYANHIVDHERNTLTYAAANLNSAVRQLGHDILNAFNDAFRRRRS